MITIKDSFIIPKITPHQAFDWWATMDNERYTKWHRDHRSWQWVDTPAGKTVPGCRVAFHEHPGRYDIKFRGTLVEMEADRYMKFRMSGLPATFSFRYEPVDGGTRVTYEATMGYDSLPGRLLDGLLKKLYPPDDYDATITRHVKEEHELISAMIVM